MKFCTHLILLLAALWLAACATPPKTLSENSVYRNVTLIDAAQAELRAGMAVFVAGDKIANIAVDSAVTQEMLEGHDVYDGRGRFMLPGLIDSHVHFGSYPDQKYSHAQMKQHIYSGVTSVRDMAGDARALADLSRAALVNEVDSPDIYFSAMMAGPDFFADPRSAAAAGGVTPGEVPWMYGITDQTNLPLAVAQARGTSATGIKVYANLSADLVKGIIAEGRKQSMPVWTHQGVYPATPFDAIGATSVSHACMIARYVFEPNKPRYDHSNPPDYSGLTAQHPDIQRYIQQLAASDTVMDATLSVYLTQESIDKSNAAGEPLRGPPCPRSLSADIIRAMNAAGVTISAGTDRPAPEADFPMLYSEIEALVGEAGFTPYQAIVAATLNGAKALGKADEMGTLETGKFANFILVQDNPLDDIAALRTLNITVKRGRRFARRD